MYYGLYLSDLNKYTYVYPIMLIIFILSSSLLPEPFDFRIDPVNFPVQTKLPKPLFCGSSNASPNGKHLSISVFFFFFFFFFEL